MCQILDIIAGACFDRQHTALIFNAQMEVGKRGEICHKKLISFIICLMYSSMSDAACTLPEDLRSSTWEYNYTDVSNTQQSKSLVISTTTLQNSVISLDGRGTTLDDWTCINNLNISSTEGVVVFKSDSTFSDGPSTSYRLYLCMKFTKVTQDLYYFYLLSDINDDVQPNERTFATSNSLADDAPICSTFCQYTEKPKIRTLRKPGTMDTLPSSTSLCACGSSCKDDRCEPNPCQNNGTCVHLTDSFNCTCAPGWEDVNCTTVTTILTSLDTPQITTLPSTSTEIDAPTNMTLTDTTDQPTITSTLTEIGTSTAVISTETTQKATISSTLIEIYTTTDVMSTKTTQKEAVPSTLTEIDTTKEMITTQTTQKATVPSTSSEIDTTAKLVLPTTTEMTLHSTSTEMGTILKLTSTGKIQTTIIHSTTPDLKSTKQTIALTDTDTETTTELKVITTTDFKDETTLETKSKDTEKIKQYSGPIILAGVVCPGFVFVIIIFVLLKHIKRHSMINTKRIIDTNAEEAFASTSEESYVFYKGENFGFQKIAIKRWDNT